MLLINKILLILNKELDIAPCTLHKWRTFNLQKKQVKEGFRGIVLVLAHDNLKDFTKKLLMI